MKNLLTAILAFFSIGLFSCQKEVNDLFKDNGNAGGSTSGLLVKTVAVTNSDSLVTLYSYDNQNRLETSTMDGISNGIQTHSYKKFIRDANSRISKILQVVDQNSVGSDTTVETVHYPNSAMEFDYTVNTISMMGFSVIDSSVYSYASGKMASLTSSLSSPLLGSTPLMNNRTDFTYDASGNVTAIKMYSDFSTGTMDPIMNQTFTYGLNAVNAEWISANGAQNFLMWGTPGTSNRAFDKAQFDDLTTPSNSVSITATYSLGTDNKPKTATMVYSNGTVTKYTFYYQ